MKVKTKTWVSCEAGRNRLFNYGYMGIEKEIVIVFSVNN